MDTTNKKTMSAVNSFPLSVSPGIGVAICRHAASGPGTASCLPGGKWDKALQSYPWIGTPIYRISPPEERKEKRQAELKPLLEEFFTWAENVQAAGGSKQAKAIGYLISEKKYLVRFLESPDVPIDNNRAENAIRPFCAGRKTGCFPLLSKGSGSAPSSTP